MIRDIIVLYGAECAPSHMQGDELSLHALIRAPFRSRSSGEVQACGWRGGAAFLACINGLVALGVGKGLGDVRRKGHLAYIVQTFLAIQTDDALAIGFDSPALRRWILNRLRRMTSNAAAEAQQASGASDGAPDAGRQARK